MTQLFFKLPLIFGTFGGWLLLLGFPQANLSAASLDLSALLQSKLVTRKFTPVALEFDGHNPPQELHIRTLEWNSQKRAYTKFYFPLNSLELTSNVFFQTQNFEIYKKYSAFPAPLNILDEKAIHLTFHLKRMEAYFREIGNFIDQPNLTAFSKPIKIRYDAKYQFSATKYYDSKNTEYNMAKTIPASDPNLARDYLAQNSGRGWETEIWFSPRFFIPIISAHMLAPVLETALCPDVIYHEYTHLITGKFLGGNVLGSALSEGLSDYYSASFLNHSNLYTSACPSKVYQRFNNGFEVNQKISAYNPKLESQFDQNFHFIPSILWKIRKILTPALADLVIMNAIKASDSGTMIFPHFIQKLSNSITQLLPDEAGNQLANLVENEVFIKAGVYSQRSISKTFYGLFPPNNLELQNTTSSYKKLKAKYLEPFGLCRQKDSFSVFFKKFSLEMPLLFVVWNCDGYKIPFVADFSMVTPQDSLLSSDHKTIKGTWALASARIKATSPVHAYLLKLANDFLGGAASQERSVEWGYTSNPKALMLSLETNEDSQTGLDLQIP